MSNYTTEDIARYAEGLMEPGELPAFEQALAADAGLQEQLALYREVQDDLQQHFTKDEGEERLKATMQDLRKEHFAPRSPGRVVRIKRFMQVTAAAAVVAALVLVVWRPWQQEDLYAEYANARMITSVERGADADSLLQLATRAFNKKDYATAVPLLEQAARQDGNNSFIQYYYAIALLETGKTDSARNILMDLHRGQSVFKHDATFYMALSYLKEDDPNNCLLWLLSIPADAGNYEKAQELSKKLAPKVFPDGPKVTPQVAKPKGVL